VCRSPVSEADSVQVTLVISMGHYCVARVTFPASEHHHSWPAPIYIAWCTEAHVWMICLGTLRSLAQCRTYCTTTRRHILIHCDSLYNHFWNSRISILTKLKLYNTCILPIFLCGSECWAVTKVDARRIDALDQWCLRTLLGIKWHQFDRNEEMKRITKQPNLTTRIIQSRRLSIFRHIASMDDYADAKIRWS